ncbi:MAG: hypothetical protein GC193_09335 [Cryomorphaceae bacterium]|nr:hypothetical protein [Cryomorphaceae bacterium]
MMRYSVFGFLFLFLFGCETKPYLTREDRRLENKNEYVVLHPNDLAFDIRKESPSTSDETIFLCIPLFAEDAVAEQQEQRLQVEIEGGDLTFEIASSSALSEKTLRLHTLVQEGNAKDSRSEKMLFHIAIAETKAGERLLVINKRELSARQISADLIEMGFINALAVERKNLNSSWYRYANTIFSCGVGQPKQETADSYLILQATSR